MSGEKGGGLLYSLFGLFKAGGHSWSVMSSSALTAHSQSIGPALTSAPARPFFVAACQKNARATPKKGGATRMDLLRPYLFAS